MNGIRFFPLCRVRGSLGSTLAMAWNVGILLMFTFGAHLDFYAAPKFVIALMILNIVLLYFLPDSPIYLYKQNKIVVSIDHYPIFINYSMSAAVSE